MNKLIIFNAESAYLYFKDWDFRKSLKGSSKMYCDSFSLSLVLKICKIPHKRLHGPDLMDNILKLNKNYKVIILGGSNQAHKIIKEKYKLNHTKFYSGVINQLKIKILIDEIKDYSPDIIFVCLGIKKQEKIADIIWQNLNQEKRFKNSIIVGVGAAVDFLGETKIRAGTLWRKFGLEWLPRLLREPRMLPRICRAFYGCILLFLNSHSLENDKLYFAKKFYTQKNKFFSKD